MTKILILEDDLDILNVITTFLQDFYEILPLSNPKNWRNEVADFKPDIAIIDVDLGDTDGTKICGELKSDPKTSNIKLILTSAFIIHPHRLMADCDAYIEKPFEIDNFLEIVSEVQTKR